jgi:arylsulfatase A-like enzyme
VAGCADSEKNRQQNTPNLVFVMADQFRASAMGFLGEEPVVTPNLDRMAGEGLVFTNATSTMPICSPYRAMLFTGKYYTHNSVPTNCHNRSPGVKLRRNDTTLLDALAGSGYSVGYIGKWHLEEPFEPYVPLVNNAGTDGWIWEEWTPPERRHGAQFWHAYNTWDQHFMPHYWTNKSTRGERLEVREWSPKHETDVAIDFIANGENMCRDPDSPFALFVSFNPPHTGYKWVPEKYKELYRDIDDADLVKLPSVTKGSTGQKGALANTRNYFACISGVDDQFGRILRCLEQEQLKNNTLVIFTSDHGNCVGAHNCFTKGVHWVESFKIPLIMHMTGIQNDISDVLVSPIDLFPTISGLLGLDDIFPETIHGQDLSGAILSNSETEPTSALYAYLPWAAADTLMYGYKGMAWGERGVQTKNHMLVVEKNPLSHTRFLLFDMKKDPHQQENIARGNKELILKLMNEELIPKLKSIGDDWWKILVTASWEYPEFFREDVITDEVF